MELNKQLPRMFDIRPTDPKNGIKGGVFGKGRILLGRSETCELYVNHDSVSAVHAVLEIFDDRAVLYDMNSTNGTYVNDDKIIVKEIHAGDFFRLADIEFEIQPYSPTSSLPPVLESLEPQRGQASVKVPPAMPMADKGPKALPTKVPGAAQSIIPSIVYPLAADPKAEFSEYIFEDKDQLYPIFKYETSKQAVEVIILHNDQIYSVDYLPEGKSTYYITGLTTNKSELEFPYLGKTEKLPFVDVNGAFATVHTLPGFSIFHLSDKKKDSEHVGTMVELTGQDIVRLSKDHLQIYVRNVSAPPKVAAAPILRRDPDFQKYLFLFLFFVGMISIGMNMVEMPEDEKKDELAPEKLATILYRQKLTATTSKAVEKTEDTPKRMQKAPQKVAVQKEIPKEQQPKIEKPDVITTKDQSQKPDPGEKTATEKKVVKQGTQKVVTPTNKIATNLPSAANKVNMPKAASATALSTFESKSIGHVEVYKSADFKSSVSSLVAKGGSLSGIKTQSPSGSGGQLVGSASGVSSGTGNIKTADIATNQGSLVGATTGVLGSSKGAEGLSAKKAIYTAGFPSETVVLGSMDPDVIRRILLEHLPQFRFCYQKELERQGADAQGVIPLAFTIGASGHVTQAGIAGQSSLPTEVKQCVVSVLRGIVFPAPMGGGKVEVKQPMNFQPKQL